MRTTRGVIRTVPAWFGLALVVLSIPRVEAQVPSVVAPTIERLEAKIAEVESTADLEETIKKKALELYHGALIHLKTHGTFTANLKSYEEAVTSAPSEMQKLRAELEGELPPLDVTSDAPKSATELEQELTQEQAELASQRNALLILDQKIAGEQERPTAAREDIAKARTRLEQVEKELKLPPEAVPVLAEARQVLLAARKLKHTTEVQMLEQEIVTYVLRQSLYQAQRDVAVRRISQREKRVIALQETLNTKRRSEAEAAQQEAERVRDAAAGKHPAVRAIADKNAALSAQVALLTKRLEETDLAEQRTHARLEELQAESTEAKTTITGVGLSGVLGAILLEQKKNLPALHQYRKSTAERNRVLAEVRVNEYQVAQELKALENLDSAANTVRSGLSPRDAGDAALVGEVRQALSDQAELLKSLDRTYDRYRNALGGLDSVERNLLAEAQKYAEFLDEQLLWTPSVPRLGLGVHAQFPGSLRWVLTPKNWKGTVDWLGSQVSAHAVLSALFFAAVAVLMLSQRWWRRRLQSIGLQVKKRYTDNLVLTLRALLVTVILAAPGPLLLGFVAWLLLEGVDAPPFARAVGGGLARVSAAYVLLRSLRFFLSKGGVADVHFRWRERVLSLYRRNLLWCGGVVLGAIFIASMTRQQSEETYHYTLGRVAFLVEMLAIAVFVGRVFPPRGGVLEHAIALNPSGWLARLRYAWFSVAVTAPLCVAGLAAAGYYYTALELERRLLATAGILFGAVIVHNLARRWLFLARMRLAIERARQKREATREAQREGEEAGEDLLVELDIPEMDLETVKEQTLDLARTAIVICAFIGTALLWADVLPALGLLDLQVGTNIALRGGEEIQEPVYLSHVLSALLVVALTLISAKNLPGFLEVAILRHLPLDPGSRYATSTIGQYILVGAGFGGGFHLIGIGWSQVQWLVAAVSVGLGFGLQEIFANFVSGLIILVERPIRVGDTVTIGEISGTVTKIRIRATTITDWDQKELVVPNKSFITGQLINWSLSNPVIRLTVKVGIEYGSDTELALKLMLAAAKSHPKVLAEPESEVFFVGFGDSSLDFQVRVFVNELTNRARTRVTHDIHMAIDQTFREHNVVIAFPQRDIHIKTEVSARSSDKGGDPSG